MSVTFKTLCDDEVLDPIHQAFGELLPRLNVTVHPHVQLAGALASEQLARGHVCFDFAALQTLSFQKDDSGEKVIRYENWPTAAAWSKELQRSELVSSRTVADASTTDDQPIVFDRQRQRVYLARYWFVQQQLAEWIAKRLRSEPLPMDLALLDADLKKLFEERADGSDRDQELAVRNAVNRKFAVVTGGPGTGKTTTVAKLLAARLLQACGPGPRFSEEDKDVSATHADATNKNKSVDETVTDESADESANEQTTEPAVEPALRIVLMAPTGKAAQRLNESLANAIQKLTVAKRLKLQLRQVAAGTIHRMLQWTPAPPERGGPFRRGPQHPLDADIVLVDEASMVDIELMWRLFAALRDDTQIILMGDRDQLASVEAGGVLSDLCGAIAEDVIQSSEGSAGSTTKSRQLARRVAAVFSNPLADAVSWLRISHRFSNASPLGQLASSIRQGHTDAVLSRLSAAECHHIVWMAQEPVEVALKQVVDQASARYRDYLEQLRELNPSAPEYSQGLRSVLLSLANVRVLCAHRDGSAGERAMNQRLAQQLSNMGLIRPRSGPYVGQAVIVTENDYRQDLFNGDVGVIVSTARGNGLAIAFEDPTNANAVRLIPTALAPAFRDCWAMTIHKSQGSEFGSVLVVLPEFVSPVLSRELLYTAVTRVKQDPKAASEERRSGYLAIASRADVLRSTIEHEIRRTSGLRDAILARCAQLPNDV